MMDKKHNLWATNPAATKPISVRTSDDIWHAFNFNGIINGKETGQLLNTASGDIWVQIFRGGGLFAFNPRNTYDTDTDDSYNLFSPKLASGETITSTVNCLAQDKNNDIWVGTDKGIAVYRNPENVFSNDNFYAEQIQLTSFAGDTTEQYLLNTENVTSIAIDGANRKWIGTENAGIFLVSEDGKKELLRFTTENSILPSNNIKDIDIDPTSGEVFIGSDKGLVSYRADAIEGKTSYDHVYAFPNPVCSDFAGVITITGLMTDSNVKITDLSGQLVFETTSKGGQATWNGCNFNGQKAATGVYLVWCALADGSSKVVTKIAFIN
jgi:ligand-binding sensor domain-containing protein